MEGQTNMNSHNEMLKHLKKLSDEREAREREKEEAELLLSGFALTQRKLAVKQLDDTYLDSTTIRMTEMRPKRISLCKRIWLFIKNAMQIEEGQEDYLYRPRKK